MSARWIVVAALFSAGSAVASDGGLQTLERLNPVMKCEALQGIDVSGEVGATTRIHRATVAGDSPSSRYCRVEGVIDPQISFEVRLPVDRWSQRFLQLGCGGLCGSLQIRTEHSKGCLPVDQGEIVLSSTDMGHSGRGGDWAARDPGAKVDFAYRGVHLTAVASKALIKRFYGRSPRYSYFSGCSDGGREGLVEAQRYPEDFDGIAAGAPALNFTVQNSFYHAWNARSNTASDGRAILIADRLPILHAAVLKACDAADGLKDGLINDPRRCNFDPAVVVCKSTDDAEHCLTRTEVEAARKIYEGAHDSQGRRLIAGGPMPGSELAWEGVFVPTHASDPIPSASMAAESVKYLYFDAPLAQSWSVADLKFDEATLKSFQLRGLYDATNPDLSRFHSRGGKLLMWHGWSDPHISPLNSIAYLKAVEQRFGKPTASTFVRLFMFPGMYHCFGGEGPFEFDVLTPLMSWVESNQAPLQINATHLDLPPVFTGPPGPPSGGPPHGPPPGSGPPPGGGHSRQRPSYPYPAVATYGGQGSPDTVENFRATVPDEPAALTWLGERFFSSGDTLSCTRVPNGMKCAPIGATAK